PNPQAPPASFAAANAYVASLTANWAYDSRRPAPPTTTLSDLTAHLADVYGAVPEEPRVLIVDQFEELFTQLPECWDERPGFFAQLQAAVAAGTERRVLLAMREDYLAQVDPHAGALSNRLQHRFRIARLARTPALAAVTRPLKGTGRHYAGEAADRLV